jgi:hypothetical protein
MFFQLGQGMIKSSLAAAGSIQARQIQQLMCSTEPTEVTASLGKHSISGMRYKLRVALAGEGACKTIGIFKSTVMANLQLQYFNRKGHRQTKNISKDLFHENSVGPTSSSTTTVTLRVEHCPEFQVPHP